MGTNQAQPFVLPNQLRAPWAKRLFYVVFGLQIGGNCPKKFFSARNQALRIFDGTDVKILRIAAIADQGRIGDQFAETARQNLRLQIVWGEAGNDC